jgi:hypothetical protein
MHATTMMRRPLPVLVTMGIGAVLGLVPVAVGWPVRPAFYVPLLALLGLISGVRGLRTD